MKQETDRWDQMIAAVGYPASPPCPNTPHLPETPWDALGPIIREKVVVEGRTFVVARPDESDRLLDHPVIRSAFARDEYLPYWTELWPAARMLAKVIIREAWAPGLEALEVGCGLGLPGIAALSCGLKVTFSDYDGTALRFAADNARANGFDDFQVLQLDWRFPPPNCQVPVLLASDLMYELRNVEPLAAFIKKVLAPGGLCLLADQERVPGGTIRKALNAAGLVFMTRRVRAGEP
ncbi:MAG TPA: methyltransferase, partial [Gemmataceae bacterium]|nr:methyltransferase [Gemmataceae bacterium]